jgi:hypothetical protein
MNRTLTTLHGDEPTHHTDRAVVGNTIDHRAMQSSTGQVSAEQSS